MLILECCPACSSQRRVTLRTPATPDPSDRARRFAEAHRLTSDAAAGPAAQPIAPPAAPEPVRFGAQIWLGVGAARIADPSLLAPLSAAGLVLSWQARALGADMRFEHAQTTRSAAQLQLDAGSPPGVWDAVASR